MGKWEKIKNERLKIKMNRWKDGKKLKMKD